METRDILDHLGNIIGSLTLPDGTTEDQWTAALTPYTVNDPVSLQAAIIETITMSESASVTTSSATASTIGGLSTTPQPGTYKAEFNGSIYTAGASATGEFGIYKNGVLIAETRRDISCNLQLLGGLVTISLNAIGVGTYTSTEIQLDGDDVIDCRFRSTNGGTIGFKERVFTLLRVR